MGASLLVELEGPSSESRTAEYSSTDSIDWVAVGGRGVVLLELDGSLYVNRSRAAAGGVIQDDNGRFIIAFAVNLGTCSIMRAELRGIIEGMKLT
ncbi:hypothetical protein LINPERHAP1_LOCUS6110 [Linum perenne]